jgi:hypothetical protein
MTTEPRAVEALDALRRSIAATDAALAALGSVDQLQERLEPAVLRLVEEPDIWRAAQDAYAGARVSLQHARGCLEELQSQITRAQSGDLQARAWADRIVDLNEKLQSHLAAAAQEAGRSYELLRPALISFNLEQATRVPRWTDTWPADAESAKQALERLRAGVDAVQVDALDLQLAEFRWDVGWPQQRIAQVVGLSQPSIAARLARLEALLSLEVAATHVRRQAERDGFRVIRSHVAVGRGSREPSGEVLLERGDLVAKLDVLVAAGSTGAARRAPGLDGSLVLDVLRLDAAGPRQPHASRLDVSGFAVYYRDRGTVGYFTPTEVAQVLRALGRLPAETILQRLRETVAPAGTPKELVERIAQPAGGAGSPA